MSELKEQHKRFANAFLECGNKTEAARRAGYSEKSARQQGSRLMTNAAVSAYIAARMEPKEQRRIASADDALVFLTGVMNGEVKDQFGLETAVSDRISAAKELLKRYDAAGRAGANNARPKIIRMADGGIEVDADEA